MRWALDEESVQEPEADHHATDHRPDRPQITVEQPTAREDRIAAAVCEYAALTDRMIDTLDRMIGRAIALDYPRKGPGELSIIARHVRVVEPGLLLDLLDDAVDEGRLTDDERNQIMRSDVVFTGRRRADGQDVYLLVEISANVRNQHVERAVHRASLLAKLGRPVVQVVAGRRVFDDAAALASALGAWTAREGELTPPVNA